MHWGACRHATRGMSHEVEEMWRKIIWSNKALETDTKEVRKTRKHSSASCLVFWYQLGDGVDETMILTSHISIRSALGSGPPKQSCSSSLGTAGEQPM